MAEDNNEYCALCNLPINANGGFSKETCGHVFHTSCLFQMTSRCYRFCPLCKSNQSLTTADISGELIPLDFGDDRNVDRLISMREACGYTFEFPHSDALNYANITSRNFMEYDGKYSTSVSNYDGKRGIKNGLDSLVSRYNMVEKREKLYGLDLETNPIILLKHKTQSHMLLRKNIDMKAIIRAGITLEYMLGKKYNLLDFIVLRATYQDLLTMGLCAGLWKSHSKLLPFMDTIHTFNLNFMNVYVQICREQFDEFIFLQFDANDMRQLHVSVAVLIEIGVDKHMLGALTRIKMIDWCKLFGLTFTHLLMLAVTTKDIISVFGWSTNIQKDSQFKNSFKELFGTDVENLDQVRKYNK